MPHEIDGQLISFKEDIKAFPVEDDACYWNLSRYIHLNPSNGSKPLAETPESYRYSTYGGYCRQRRRLNWIACKRVTIKVAPKKVKAFQQRIKVLTGRSRGISMARRLTDHGRYVRGWIGYFGLARQFEDIVDLDGWIRRRVRMCYWKQWRHPRTKVKNLVSLGVSLGMAIQHANSRKKYWRMSRTPALRYAMTNKWLEQQGLLSLKQLWCKPASLRGTA